MGRRKDCHDNSGNSFCHKHFVSITVIIKFLEQSNSGLCYQFWRCLKMFFILWGNFSQFINSHLSHLENSGPRDDIHGSTAASFILVPMILIWASLICQVSTVKIRIVASCLVLSFSQTYALLNLHYHSVTLPNH